MRAGRLVQHAAFTASVDGFVMSTWKLHNGPSGARCQQVLNWDLLEAGTGRGTPVFRSLMQLC